MIRIKQYNRPFWPSPAKKPPPTQGVEANDAGMKALFLIDKNRQIGKMYVNLEYGNNSVSIEQFRSKGRFSVMVTGKSANKIIFISNSPEKMPPLDLWPAPKLIIDRKSLLTGSLGQGDIISSWGREVEFSR